jgi:cytochrome c peroxidase
MKTIFIICTAAVFSGLFFGSCNKDANGPQTRMPKLPEEVFRYNEIPEGPNGFQPAGLLAIDNHKATLGRVLFYETQLSVNNRVSCGSCHRQDKAFADRMNFSDGFENKKTLRNTPAICNPGTQQAYFWDMRETNLDAMVTQPISNHIEMGLESPEYIVAKVNKLPYYKTLFEAAFGDAQVNINRIGDALSHFTRSMVSVQSRYDAGVASGFSNFTSQELQGKSLFFESLPCGGCHGGENFSGWGSFTQNIGLEMDYADDGQPGDDWSTGQPLDGWFKVPSLRNIELTAPYMHDGRFSTLEDVVEFYNSQIEPHPQLSFALREGWGGGISPFGDGPTDIFIPEQTGEVKPLRMNLTNDQKMALVAFLKTLTDYQMISDAKFSDPFVY